MPSTTRLAIAGLKHGHIYWLLRDWRRPDLEVTGFWETDSDLARRHAGAFNIPADLLFENLETMLDEVQPEGVCAFGPISEHLMVVEACAPRGIHVMVEKPLAYQMDQAKKMAALARRHGIHLITNFETNWYASTYEAYRLAVEEKILGPIRKIVVHSGHRGPKEIGVGPDFLSWLADPEQNGGGAIVDFGCYGVNLSTWLLGGEEPETVTAVAQTFKPESYPAVDDEATIILGYRNSQTIVQASWNWPVNRKDMEIYGRDGYLLAPDRESIRLRSNLEQPEETLALEPAPEVLADPFKYFSAVVRGEEVVAPGNLWSLENALTVARVLDAARLSVREGKTIRLV